MEDDTVQRFTKRVLVFGMAFLLLTPFVPVGAQEHFINEGGLGHDAFMFEEAGVNDMLTTIGDQDDFVFQGIISKGAEVHLDVDPSEYTQVFPYEVKAGDTLSSIAGKFGVKVETLRMTNDIYGNSVGVGRTVYIPPVDGVIHTVEEKDTLSSIAEKYEAKPEDIRRQNDLKEDETLSVGMVLIVPGGIKAPPPPVIIASGSSSAAYVGGGYAPPSYPPAAANPSGGWIFPTSSNVVTTQRFSGYHKGVDLASRASPPIYAAYSGVVEKVSVGTYGGGYGNHVIVNHGNGIKTLYAHLAQVNVQKGQRVNTGDVLGPMGTTGRSTGIHLHFEVHVNGVPQNPFNFVGR